MNTSGAETVPDDPPAGTGQSDATGRSRVAVAACDSYSPDRVKSALEEILSSLGGMSAFVKPGQTVLVKPNLFSAHPPEHGVTTHPEVVRQVALLCIEAGARRVWVGDSPVGLQPEARLWSLTGMDKALAGTRAELKSWKGPQIPVNCGDDILAVPEWYRDIDVIVSLPKLKTHGLTTITCGLKNVYGMVNGPAKSQFHVKYPSPATMSSFLVRVFAAFRPALTIADAIVAMEGNGPAHGQPLSAGLLLASRDAVALDAVACAALKISPATVPMIRMAAASGLGIMEAPGIQRTGSGLTRLETLRMKPSVARYLGRIPEVFFRLTPCLVRLHPKIRNRLCDRCGTCVRTCPKNAINKNRPADFPVIDRRECIDCFCCIESCPKSAIAARLYIANLFFVMQQRRDGAAEK
jgi:uncharacterized protein (DUF362 family)/NAD-dependent dihydropyrimidine dehydrogenase PreA subunit